jgi:hypothetical protein
MRKPGTLELLQTANKFKPLPLRFAIALIFAKQLHFSGPKGGEVEARRHAIYAFDDVQIKDKAAPRLNHARRE